MVHSRRMTPNTTPRIGSLFSGVGGLDMGVQSVLGGRVVWHSEIDPGACKVLEHHWPDVPNLGDVSAVDWADVEPVDVLTGGFPCQDVSLAGRRAGLIRDGEGRTRSGLWGQMLRAVDELRPGLVIAENVRGLLSAKADSDMEQCPDCMGEAGDDKHRMRALGAVLADLAGIGYDATWIGLRASDVGAPHQRFRVFVFAYPAEDADVAACSERGLAAPGQAQGWRAWADARGRGRASATDPGECGRDGGAGDPQRGEVGRAAPARGGEGVRGGQAAPIADADGSGCAGVGRVDAVRRDSHGCSSEGRPRSATEPATLDRERWGIYADAVERWASIVGLPPEPTAPDGRAGAKRLAPAFPEWMMGFPAGHVTAPEVGLSRKEQLKAIGNGVVPQQAAEALRRLFEVA